MANGLRRYRFEIDTPVSKKITSIIVNLDDAKLARSYAYDILYSKFGPGSRVKTSAEDAKIMRRMPNNIEAVHGCYTRDNKDNIVPAAWFVFAD